uniref:Uncharacterized protein n=2 Tax=Lotharella globosa TaxID=91324 RepID=A0A7S3Y9E3_9EUKA
MKLVPRGAKKPEGGSIPETQDERWKVIKRLPTVYAVKTTSEPLTDDTVTQMHDQLLNELQKDNLKPEFEEGKTFVQFDELYSLSERRNEIWVPLDPDGYPWPY